MPLHIADVSTLKITTSGKKLEDGVHNLEVKTSICKLIWQDRRKLLR